MEISIYFWYDNRRWNQQVVKLNLAVATQHIVKGKYNRSSSQERGKEGGDKYSQSRDYI